MHTFSNKLLKKVTSMQRPAAVPPRLLGDGPDGVDDAGEVAEEGEDEADPELNLRKTMQESSDITTHTVLNK
jgi:hypothetical protein